MSRLEEIKEDVENNAKKEHEFVTTILYEDALYLINRVEELEKENEHLQEIVDSCRCPEAEHGQLLKGEFE